MAEPIDSASFLPQRLVARLSEGPGAQREVHFQGAALFADISGYVKLTEQFCREGEQGLAQLSALLDHSFGRYVNVVAQHGGEVAYFAGDGLAAYWDGAAHDAAAHAVACGIALRGVERNPGPGHGVNPDLHVGVADGALWGAKLRSVEERCDVLLGGAAMRDAARAETHGARGEVVVSARVADVLGTRLSTAPRPDGHRLVHSMQGAVELAAPPHPKEAHIHLAPGLLRPMLPGPLVREDSGALDWSAEIREVCALFARIDGLHEMQEGALQAFQTAARVVHETMRGFAGTPGQLVIDDKGLVFHIAFGAPFNAHADDHRRAAHAALALQARLGELGLGAAIGLASGRAFCGVLGNDVRREYATVGRPMNLAARLMASATEGIRCTGFGPGLTLDGIDCVPAQALRPKGVEQPLPVYRLRLAAQAFSRPPLCGRRGEQALLLRKLQQLDSDTSAVVALVGEAGFGKTSLLCELGERARELGIDVAFGQASASPSAVYSAWRGVFVARFGLTPTASQAEARAQVLTALARAPELLPLAPLLNAVLPLELPETEVTRHLEGQPRIDASLRLFADCFERVTDRPLLIVLEDGHGMDSSSWRLCARLARHVRGVLLVIGLRPMPDGVALQALPPDRLTTLTLGALSSSEAGELMCHTLGTRAVSPELADTVHRLTQGNPLFVREYTLLLNDRGVIRVHDDGIDFTDCAAGLGSTPPPLTVQAAITSRLDDLNPIERLALKTASVAGQAFDAELLAEIYPVPEQRVEARAALDGLCARQLLQRDPRVAGHYVFSHALIRDVAYNLMLHDQRIALHRTVALTWLARAASENALDHALLTHHFHLAGEVERTLHHGDLAAQSALRAGAHREAARLLETCLALSPNDTPASLARIRRHRWLADAHAGLGDNTARDAQARKALALAPRPLVDRQARATARALGAITLRATLDFLRAPAQLASVEQRALHIELAKAHRHRADVCYYESDARGLVASLLASIAHAQPCGPSADLAASYAQFGGSLGIMGLHPLADRVLARAIRAAQDVGEPLALAHVHMIRALYCVGMARWDDALYSVHTCQELCERMHDPVTWGSAQMIAFWASHYRGQNAHAGVLARTLLQRAEKLGHAQHTVWGLRAMALFELERGAPIDALGHIERAVRNISRTDHENELLSAWGICALVRYRVGDLAGARDAVDRVLSEASSARRPTAHSTLAGWSGLTEVSFALHAADPDVADLRRQSVQALRGLARHPRVFPVGEPTYRYFRGVQEAQSGNLHAARRQWRKGQQAADRLGAHCDRERLTQSLAQRTAPTPRRRSLRPW